MKGKRPCNQYLCANWTWDACALPSSLPSPPPRLSIPASSPYPLPAFSPSLPPPLIPSMVPTPSAGFCGALPTQHASLGAPAPSGPF